MGSARAPSCFSSLERQRVCTFFIFTPFDDGRVEIRRNEFLLYASRAIRARFSRMEMLSDCVFFLLPVVLM